MSVSERRKHIGKRTRTTYDNRRDGRHESQAPPDDRTLSGVVPATLARVRMKEGPLVLRPFPMLSYDDPANAFEPERLSDEDFGQSDWVVKVACAAYVGMENCPKFTFLLYPPGTPKEIRQNNPYRIFYYACKNANEAGSFGGSQKWDSDWNKLFVESKGHGAALSQPTFKWFMQGAILQGYDNKGQPKDFMGAERDVGVGLDPGDDLTVIQVSVGCGTSLMRLLDQRKDDFEGDAAQDPSLPFVHGNVLGRYEPTMGHIRGGRFITIFHPAKTKITVDSSWNGQLANVPSFECALTREYVSGGRTYKPGLNQDDVQQLFKKVQFWFDDPETKDKGLLNFPPPEQQVAWIAQAFRNVPKMVLFAFSENEQLLTAEVRGILAAKTAAVMPNRGEPDDDDDTPAPKTRTRSDPTQVRDIYDRADDVAPPEDDEAPAPRGRQAAPVEDDEAPVPAPRGRRAAPPDDEAPPHVPRGRRAAPPEDDEAPAPRGRQAAPVEDDEAPAPRGRQAAPVEDDEDEFAAPDDEEPVPVPRGRRAAPPVETEEPEVEDEAPVPAPRGRRAAPPEEDEAPVPAPRGRQAAPAASKAAADEEDLFGLNKADVPPTPAPAKRRPAPVADVDEAAEAAEARMRVARDAARVGAERSSHRAGPATAATPPPPPRATARRK